MQELMMNPVGINAQKRRGISIDLVTIGKDAALAIVYNIQTVHFWNMKHISNVALVQINFI